MLFHISHSFVAPGLFCRTGRPPPPSKVTLHRARAAAFVVVMINICGPQLPAKPHVRSWPRPLRTALRRWCRGGRGAARVVVRITKGCARRMDSGHVLYMGWRISLPSPAAAPHATGRWPKVLPPIEIRMPMREWTCMPEWPPSAPHRCPTPPTRTERQVGAALH